jgi:hypothetical protein
MNSRTVKQWAETIMFIIVLLFEEPNISNQGPML